LKLQLHAQIEVVTFRRVFLEKKQLQKCNVTKIPFSIWYNIIIKLRYGNFSGLYEEDLFTHLSHVTVLATG